jgi:hypothetical protein
MQARDVHCSNVIGEGRRMAWFSLHVFACLMVPASTPLAQTGPAASHVIAPIEQVARDDDRLEILRHELKKLEEQLHGLARRKAERLAAHDMEAATEAEEQRVRTLGDIAALKREIGLAAAAAGPSTAVKPSAFDTARGRPVSAKGMAPPPWWDVYRGSRHNGPPVSSSSPAPEQSVRQAPARPSGVAP